MGFSGGGGSQTLPHTHDSNIANDGGALQFNNVTQGTMGAGDLTYSDGSHLQVLTYPAIPAGETLQAEAASSAPAWVAGAAGPEVCYAIESLDEDGLGFVTDFYGVEITDGSSPVFAKTIVTVSFWLRINGTPSGNGYVYIYDSDGALQATSDSPIQWNNLTGSWTKYTFTFATPHTIAVGDKIVIGGGTIGIGMEVSFYGDQNQSQTTFQSLVEYGSGTGDTWSQINGGTSGARWCYTT